MDVKTVSERSFESGRFLMSNLVPPPHRPRNIDTLFKNSTVPRTAVMWLLQLRMALRNQINIENKENYHCAFISSFYLALQQRRVSTAVMLSFHCGPILRNLSGNR